MRLSRYALPLTAVFILFCPGAVGAWSPEPSVACRQQVAFKGPATWLANLLSALWEKNDSVLDPHGGTSTGDNGSGLDPDGRPSTTDNGSGLDPDGRT